MDKNKKKALKRWLAVVKEILEWLALISGILSFVYTILQG